MATSDTDITFGNCREKFTFSNGMLKRSFYEIRPIDERATIHVVVVVLFQLTKCAIQTFVCYFSLPRNFTRD
jgi:hypothetical protein